MMDSIHLPPRDESTLPIDQAAALNNTQLSIVKAAISVSDDADQDQVSCSEDEPRKIPVDTAAKGTMITSMISMTVTMVGLGILGLPTAFAKAGAIGGVLLVVLCGVATDFGLVALVRMQKKSGGECYEDLAEFFCGKVGRGVVYFLVNLDLLMGSAQQLTPFAQFTGKTIISWSNCAPPTETKKITEITSECSGWNQYTITLIPLVLVFPFFLMKSIDALKYASAISVFCLCVSMIIFFVYYASWSHINDSKIATAEEYYDLSLPIHKSVSLWPTNGMAFMESIGIIFFAYICHFQIMLLYGEMKTKKNIYPVIHGSTLGFATPLYILIGLFGYFLFGENAEKNNGMMFDLFDPAFSAGQIAVFAIGVTSAYKMALFINPVRNAARIGLNVIALKYGKPESFIPNNLWYRIPAAVVLSIIAYVVALFVPLGKMLVYAGSLTGASLGGYVIGGLLIQYVMMYGVQMLPESTVDAASVNWMKFGICSWSTFHALSPKMKRSYVLAWVLIVYGLTGTILGLLPDLVNDLSSVS